MLDTEGPQDNTPNRRSTKRLPKQRLDKDQELEDNRSQNGDLEVDQSQPITDRRKQNSTLRSSNGNYIDAKGGSDDSEEEVDAQKLKVNFGETKQIHEILHKFEEDYSSSKAKVNRFDAVALDASVKSKIVMQCYKYMKQNLYNDNPNFDREMMESTITGAIQLLSSDLKSLATLKGEYFSSNDTIINKDSNSFKLDMIKKARAKQLRILERFEEMETKLDKDDEKVEDVEQRYAKFEALLFQAMIEDTIAVVSDTNQLMEDIDIKMDGMTQDIIKTKSELASVTPQNKEHIAKLGKIQVQIAMVEKTLETADEEMERNDQTKEKITETHAKCQKIFDDLTHLEMVEMIEQTKQISQLVSNLKSWQALYKRLKMLKEDQIQIADLDLQKAIADSSKYVDSVSVGRKEEYDDLIRKIQKAAKVIGQNGEEQKGRLETFEQSNLEGNMVNMISDSDIIFLRKECARITCSLQTLQIQKDNTLEESIKIDSDLKKTKGLSITTEDLHSLRQNLKSLDGQQNVDMPRITKNIDMLEAFAIKALKAKLNEDNKRSQNQISLMKRNYEDLQREIDNLNNKLAKVKDASADLKVKLDTEDKEKENDVKLKVDDKIQDCDRDINGDKADRSGDERDKTKPQSLQARKKEIIAAINKMVNLFNDNNKAIKDNNKVIKSEKEMADLITRNQEIQDDCQSIDDKVNDGKLFAEQIDERLNLILNPTIPELEAKYEEKNTLIDECDEKFDGCEAKMKTVEAGLIEAIAKVAEALAKIEDASPLNYPSSKEIPNKDFIEGISNLNNKGHDLQNRLEGLQEQTGELKDKLMDIIQPLNELGDREVKTPEIQKILDQLKAIEAQLKTADGELGDMLKEVEELIAEVEKHLEGEKNKKIEDADEKLGQLEKALSDLADVKHEAKKKLEIYKDMIEEAKLKEGQDDPALMGTLKKLEKEAQQIGDQLKDIDNKELEIIAKKDEAKNMIDDAYASPDNYTPQQIDGIIDGIADLKTKVDALNDRDERIDKDLQKRIDDLLDMLNKSKLTKALEAQIAENLNQMKSDLGNLKDLIKKLPEMIAGMRKTLDEMKLGSTPDETADYWEERKDIEKWIKALDEAKEQLENIEVEYVIKEKKFKELQSGSKKCNDIPSLQTLAKELKEETAKTSELLEKCFDVQDIVVGTQKEMSDCQIPVNIRMRASEIVQFSERLEAILEEFKELKAADEAYEGSSESEKEIKVLIEKIDRKLKGFDVERDTHRKFQLSKLEAYQEKDIMSLKNAPIVTEVRVFKEKIEDSRRRLKELDEIMRELNNKLIAQDMSNAANLLDAKAAALRKRLQIAKDELNQINQAGDQMDGNTSNNEEEEFIDALKEEMPEVFKNVEAHFEQLDKVDDLIEDVLKNKQIETMQELKELIEDATTKVEQCEGLGNKLENEIIEWDAFKKLCRRDEELQEIESLVDEFKTDMDRENKQVLTGQLRQEEYIEKSQNSEKPDNAGIEDAKYLLEGIENFKKEIADLEKDVKELKDERDQCFGEFDADVPSSVKVDRNKRMAAALGKKRGSQAPTESDKPEDTYYKIQINCRYRQRIHDLLKNLRNINQKRRALTEKYAGLMKDLNVVKEVKLFKAIKGDAVDEMWCEHLNRHQIQLDVKRLGPGSYMFGTKKIMCKIINGKLVVRVGGGYMSADEFIEQYGRIEMLKMMKQQHDPQFEEARKSYLKRDSTGLRAGSTGRGSVGMGDMKAMMMDQLNNAQTYEEGPRFTKDQPRQTSPMQKKKTTLLNAYEPVKFGGVANASPKRGTTLGGSPKASRPGSNK